MTITGSYDGDQPGALTHYREYMKNASAEGRARHYLIIGPWDHAATRTPRAEIGGLKFAPASLVDLPQLHLDWYAWTMQGGPKPQFLQKAVAYYVMGAERWRYADTLEAVTAKSLPYYLDSEQQRDRCSCGRRAGSAGCRVENPITTSMTRMTSSFAADEAISDLEDLTSMQPAAESQRSTAYRRTRRLQCAASPGLKAGVLPGQLIPATRVWCDPPRSSRVHRR